MTISCFERFFNPVKIDYPNYRCFCSLRLQTATLLVCLFEFIYCAAVIVFGALVEHHLIIIYHSIILVAALFLLTGRLLRFKICYVIYIVVANIISWVVFLFCGVWWIVFAVTDGRVGWNYDDYRFSMGPVKLTSKALIIVLGVFFIFIYFVHCWLISLVFGDYKYIKSKEHPEIVIVTEA
ncbi:hypothetical protein M3Y97_00163200 [Aphelenchoides bicaudatus]|nr:hypothetical protein M3Y97_00163200 [Aphelenchoides bicaudatus]